MGISKINTINQTQYNNIRQNIIAGLIGVNKTGKSTTAQTICNLIKQAKGTDHTFVGHDPQRMFRHLIKPQHLINAEDDEWAMKCCKLRNCTLILDEIKMLCRIPQHPPHGLVTLFSQCFYWNIDIIWITHNPSLVPEICTFYTTMYYIFLTFKKEGQFQKKIPNYSLCVGASNYVNKYVAKYGRGHHVNDPLYNGQGFPYAIVNTETQKTSMVNMLKPI